MYTSLAASPEWLAEMSSAPPWVRYVAIGQGALIALCVVVAYVHRRRKPAARSAADEIAVKTMNREQRIDAIMLTVVTVILSGVFAAYAICTFEGMVAFAENTIGWTDWQKFVPWGIADAAGIGFSILRVFAVRKKKFRQASKVGFVVAAAMTGAAGAQLAQGGENHKLAAGAFLAFVAILGVVGLEVVIGVITAEEEKAKQEALDAEKRKNPPFGWRWALALPSTFWAFRAWHVYPPPKGTDATVQAALDNLKRVRAERIAERGKVGLGWFPLVRTSSIQIALDEYGAGVERTAREEIAAAEQRAAAEQAAIVAKVAELTDRLRTVEAERDAAQQQAEKNRSQVGHVSQTVEAKEATVAALRTELADARRAAADEADGRVRAERTAADASARADAEAARADALAIAVRPRPSVHGADASTDGRTDADPKVEDAAQRWLDGRSPTARQAATDAGITDPWGDDLRQRITRAKRRLEKQRTAAASA